MPYPALVASHLGVWCTDRLGDVFAVSRAQALQRLAETPHLILNGPMTAARLGVADISGLDLLELYLFVFPARFVVPSAAGLAKVLGLTLPQGPEETARFLTMAAESMLSEVASPDWQAKRGARRSAEHLERRGWPWAPLVLAQLPPELGRGVDLFDSLSEWEETPPRPRSATRIFPDAEVRTQLTTLAGPERPSRPGQEILASTMLHAFQPRETENGPNLVVAEAGTGIGKTLAYLAPASLYAEKTGGAVWLSTYTRALQRQLKAESARSLQPLMQAGKVVVRKGRENYLCLLNLEDALQGGFAGRAAIFAELVARWARYSEDGDMVGGDLPGWLPGLFRRNGNALPALTDRRGECIRAACPHYRRCFIEKNIRAGEQASLVIANHALVMAHAVRAHPDSQHPKHMVFDEGHHLHAAADSAFALIFSGAETIELRRWFLGPERGSRRAGRRRGLSARLMDVASQDEKGSEALDAVLEAARQLPSTGWLERIATGMPTGPVETLLAAIRSQILARAEGQDQGFTLEIDMVDPMPGLPEAADEAIMALATLHKAMVRLQLRLVELVKEGPPWLDPPGEARLLAAEQGLAMRLDLVTAWQQLVARLAAGPEPDFVDWLQLVRYEGRELDCGIWRHWLDPLKPLAKAVVEEADGVVVTSATLGRPPEQSVGASYLAVSPHVEQVRSPFDYAANSRVFIVTDIPRRDTASIAMAYAQLIEASGGGALGLFTAISRLRAVHARIADRLARAGLPLFAQHVDHVDTGTLVDLFRADPKATLFGTDALRDGVDVPGESLRLLLFEGVPWSRPTILHTARKAALGGSAYEDRLVRQRLAQAFGRLIRTKDDRGCFVLLGPAVPSRLLEAFPPDVVVERLPLGEVVTQVREFLAQGDCLGRTDQGIGQAGGSVERQS